MSVFDAFLPATGPVAVHPIVVGPLTRKAVSLCVAMPGIGKSTWTQAAAIAIRHERPDLIGETFHTTPLWPGHVILMASEDPQRIVNAKLGTMETYFGLGASPPKHGISLVNMAGRKLFKLGDNEQVEFVAGDILDEMVELRRQHDIALIVIDTLSTAMQGINESNAEQMQAVMDLLNELANSACCSVLLVHHASKVSVGKDESLSLYSARGSSVLPASVRSAFVLARPARAEGEALLKAGENPAAWVKLEIVKSSYADASMNRPRWFRFISVDIPAYDPRDNSQHTMSMGILEPRQFPSVMVTGGLPSPLKAFGTLRQQWDILKDVLKSGTKVYGYRKSSAGKVVAKDILGVTPDEAEVILDELVKVGIIAIPNQRTREIVWNGRADLPPDTLEEAQDEARLADDEDAD